MDGDVPVRESSETQLPSDDQAPGSSAAGAVAKPPLAEDRLRLLFDNMLEGFAYCRMIYDEQERPLDFLYIAVNPAFNSLTGLSDVVGKRVTEVIPGIEDTNPEIFEIYDRVTRTGEPHRFEVEVEQLGIALDVSVFRPEPDHFVAVFQDITDKKRLEDELRELNRFLEYRVEERTRDLAEALRLRLDE